MCMDGDLLVGSALPDGMTRWRAAARLPTGVGACLAHVATWQGKVMVIGSARIGEPHVGYVLEANGTWERVEFQEGFSGHVQAGCLFEI
ncbi:hypothetical protein MLD38_030184 [Melastoma candidum]|nr:hypothetical protein MLD38_030184 [Melastoma candidum]